MASPRSIQERPKLHTGQMSGRYYEAEHFAAYERLRREGGNHWNDLHGDRRGGRYEDFEGRDFLERALRTRDRTQGRRVLEYGCGTGAAACFLAERGFHVDAVDLVPDAIVVARRFAAERGLDIRFAVQDICEWLETDDRFDYVVDIFCLQSIVTDADRSSLFASVRSRLEPGGQYLINSAMHEPERDYGDDRYDPRTGIVWTRVPGQTRDSVRFADSWYVPNRRHLTAEALHLELEVHGFRILEQSGRFGGEIVCTPAT